MAHSDREARLPATVWWLLAIGAAALAYAHARITVVGPDAARFSFDSAEYALAGRMWLETGRLATPFVHPAALGSSPGPPYPLLVGHPLLPALDALAFALFGLDPLVTLLPAALAFVATVLLVAKLALALSGSRAAALGAAGSFALTPWSLRFASEGLSELPFTALLTAAFFVLWRLPERPRPWLLGVLLGLAQLTRPVAVPLLPAFALGVVVLSPPGQALAVSARTLLAFAPLAALTALYKWVAIGTPFAEVGGYLLLTGAAPEFVVSKLNRMTPPPDALAWIRAHPGEWIAKLVRNILSVSYGVWAQGGRWPVAAALVTGAVVAFRGPARARCSRCFPYRSRSASRGSRVRSKPPVVAGADSWRPPRWARCCSPWYRSQENGDRHWPADSRAAASSARASGAASASRCARCCPKADSWPATRRRGSRGSLAVRSRSCRSRPKRS
jgi:hypothetical protein